MTELSKTEDKTLDVADTIKEVSTSSMVIPKIPGGVGSAKGFLKMALSTGDTIPPELVEEYGFGVIMSMWYMTTESKHLPLMMMEFSSLMDRDESYMAFSTTYHYEAFPLNRKNLMYNCHMATYFFFKQTTDGYDEAVVECSQEHGENETDPAEKVAPMFTGPGIERLCALSIANPKYREAIVRCCFIPLKHDRLVNYTIQALQNECQLIIP